MDRRDRNLVTRADGQVLLLFDGQALWFQSINSGSLVLAIDDHIDAMLATDHPLPAPPALAD